MTPHCKRQINYQKRNPEKVKTQAMARRYPHLLIVLYECLHRDRKIENHHPDYSKWRRVYKVCSQCHCLFHPIKGPPNRGLTAMRKEETLKRSQEKRIAFVLAKEEMAKRILDIRKTLGFSQEKFAKEIGLSGYAQVSTWENGHEYPRTNFLRKIENLFSSLP